MPEKICPCCKAVIDLRNLPPEAKPVESDGLVYFQCQCGDTLVVESEVLKNMLLNNAWATLEDRSATNVTLILNYFLDGELLTEIKEYPGVEQALKRVEEVRAMGIDISPSHYGIYEISAGKITELTGKAA